MSFESSAIAFNHSKAKGTAKLILLGIASHDGTGGAWPSVEVLARYGNCTVRNAQMAIAKLVELGEIRVHKNQGGTATTPDHMRPNLYEFLLKCPPDCDGTKQHRSRYELDPLKPTSPPEAHFTTPLKPTSPELPINYPSINNLNNKRQVPTRARDKTTTDGIPKSVPKQPVPLAPLLTPDEQEIANYAMTLPCEKGPRETHWYPPRCRICAQCEAPLEGFEDRGIA